MKFPILRTCWLKYWLDRFQWYRRFAGGKWELWWVDVPVCSDIWHDVRHFTHEYVAAADRMGYKPPKGDLDSPYWYGFRPTPLCRGTPICEDWRKERAK
jgi:hypothetical protein